MPELPEVETVVRGLRKMILGKLIKSAFSDTHQLFETKKLLKTICNELKGDGFVSIDRHGKYLIFNLKSGRIMLAHMKMTGHFLVIKKRKSSKGKNLSVPVERSTGTDEKYVRFSITFTNGAKLLFLDVRKFGRIWLLKKNDLAKFFESRKMGHDALSKLCTPKYLGNQLKKDRAIKALLLDQTCVAGVGNIYADELLWLARIHPQRRGNSLSSNRVKKIHQAMRHILDLGIKAGGTSIRDYLRPDGSSGYFQMQRAVYQRAGEKCSRCGTKIKRIVVAQRSTHFCPKCQKL